jgi:hypothetical protein
MRLKVAALGTVLLCILSVAGAQAEKHARPIYRCQIDGITTFSDRACGDAIEVYKLEFDNAAQPLTKADTRPAAASSTSAPSRKAAPPKEVPKARAADNCGRITETIENIESRLRAGYRAREGEQLNARLAQAKERRKAQKCR